MHYKWGVWAYQSDTGGCQEAGILPSLENSMPQYEQLNVALNPKTHTKF